MTRQLDLPVYVDTRNMCTLRVCVRAFRQMERFCMRHDITHTHQATLHLWTSSVYPPKKEGILTRRLRVCERLARVYLISHQVPTHCCSLAQNVFVPSNASCQYFDMELNLLTNVRQHTISNPQQITWLYPLIWYHSLQPRFVTFCEMLCEKHTQRGFVFFCFFVCLFCILFWCIIFENRLWKLLLFY